MKNCLKAKIVDDSLVISKDEILGLSQDVLYFSLTTWMITQY